MIGGVLQGHVFIATSLDGFIARDDGSIDWLNAANAAGEDHGYGDFIAGMDAILMGRETFRTVAGFEPWPFQLPVLVLSRTQDSALLPAWLAERVAIVRSLPEATALAAARGWRNLYIDGGETIRSALAAGLVRSLVISRLPVLLGQGRPLFGPQVTDVEVRHVCTRSFPSGLVQSRYEWP
ncbi:dihydrofolate reductase family protein [Sandarakinorhabdus rubra]|uniref:dihydrofolate reductase family protein n=1 Tax=Sandarakinorhabdus rubra TaxID=2672568 RepID=UPI0013D91B2D|nr:dihydrofolate reductase family protein [Sandarakinorhabdus rubra]